MQQHPGGGAQPLPLIDGDDADVVRLQQIGSSVRPDERDHEDAVWYRLVTGMASCYTYVLLHTDVEPCRFRLAPDGTGSCNQGTARRWEVSLSPAAYRAFPVVVELWRAGSLNHCEQVIVIKLGEPWRTPDGAWNVDISAAEASHTRTRTVAHRDA
ncbi:MAG: hypothetical protein ACYDCQ_02080 [Dehalococcoidia bacterium]